MSSLSVSTRNEMERLKAVKCPDAVEIGLPTKVGNNDRCAEKIDMDGVDFIMEDVDCLEVVVDDSDSAQNVLHEGMVEPELD